MMTEATRTLACALLPLTMAACGGNGEKTVGGSLSGLLSGSTLILQDNGGDNLTLSANGSFEFATNVAAGGTYNVTVLTQPAGEICTIAGGAGTIDASGDPISSVAVTCVSNTNITGTVSGLAPWTSVTLTDTFEQLPIADNGAFSFTSALPVGTSYTVTVVVQPVGETCTVTNGSGTVQANVAANVVVSCS
jgi:hypothetical protein